MNFRTALNEVLRTLGEKEIPPSATSLTDTYHKMVATFMNQIKYDIEELHDWRAQVTSVQVIGTPDSQGFIDASGVLGPRDRVATLAQPGAWEMMALVYDQTEGSNPVRLRQATDEYVRHRIVSSGNDPYGPPAFFCTKPTPSGIKIGLYPIPQKEVTLSLTVYQPQADLTPNNIMDEILFPHRPLIDGTIYYALAERGEELGINNIYTEERWRQSVASAASIDSSEQGSPTMMVV